MPVLLKAIVFRTSKLKETKDFFINVLGFVIKESSVTHFVIHDKGLRILFVEQAGLLETEIYLNNKPAGNLRTLEDPNQIKIIIT